MVSCLCIEKLFPQVTRDFNEYKELSGSDLQKPSKGVKAYYYNGIIWIKDLDPLRIAHEYTHYILNSLGNSNFLTRRFLDLIDFIQDSFYHYLRYKGSRDLEARQVMIEGIHEIVEDIKMWITCEEVC